MIKRLLLQSFRCYDSKDITFEKVNIIAGHNGCGKTSIVEAISLLGGSAGIRSAGLSELIKIGYNGCGIFVEHEKSSIGIRVESGVKTVTSDGETIKASSLGRVFKIVSMAGHDSLIFASGKSEVRDFFDRIADLLISGHEKEVSLFKSLASERLRIVATSGDAKWVVLIEKQMAESLCKITYNRISSVNIMLPILAQYGIGIHIDGMIESLLLGGKSFTDAEQLMQKEFARNRASDAESSRTKNGCTSINYDVSLDGINILIGSSGEQKFCVIMLLIACIMSVKTSNKILILDDFPAKLDDDRQSTIYNVVKNLDVQSFMTGVSFNDMYSNKIDA